MIRETLPKDREGVVELIKSFFNEELIKFGYSFIYEKACNDFDSIIKFPFVYSLVIDNGSIDGFIGAVLAERPFLSGKTAQELMWYVKPEKRKDGIKLLHEFEMGCAERKCNDIMMIGLEGSKSQSIYERIGYKKQESMFFKRLGE